MQCRRAQQGTKKWRLLSVRVTKTVSVSTGVKLRQRLVCWWLIRDHLWVQYQERKEAGVGEGRSFPSWFLIETPAGPIESFWSEEDPLRLCPTGTRAMGVYIPTPGCGLAHPRWLTAEAFLPAVPLAILQLVLPAGGKKKVTEKNIKGFFWVWVCVQVKANIKKDLGNRKEAEEESAEWKGMHLVENGLKMDSARRTLMRCATRGAPARPRSGPEPRQQLWPGLRNDAWGWGGGTGEPPVCLLLVSTRLLHRRGRTVSQSLLWPRRFHGIPSMFTWGMDMFITKAACWGCLVSSY